MKNIVLNKGFLDLIVIRVFFVTPDTPFISNDLSWYPGTTSFRPPKKYFVLFYLFSSPIVLVIALYYLSDQEQQI